MRKKPIRVLAAVAGVVLAGLAVAALSRTSDPRPAVVATDMTHGAVRFTAGQERRILNAIEGTTAQTAGDALVAEGRRLFRDKTQFQDGESCQTCHAEGSASAKTGTMVHDTKAPPTAPMPPTDFDGPRDAPALWGLAKTPPYFWDGDVATLQKAVERPVLGHMKRFVTGECRPVAHDPKSSVPANPDRPASCDADAGAIAAKLIAYIRTLDPPTTAFDEGRMSPAALRGEKLFQGKGGCIECHGGPLFTDNLVHNTGVPQVDIESPYSSRALHCRTEPSSCTLDLGGTPPPEPAACTGANPPLGCEDKPRAGTAFVNTPQLRDLRNTAPYMHNGAFATLEQVVRFYNGESTVAPLNLSDAEVDDLVAYLEAL
jgi:cytochrome c peroxidase